MPKIIHQHTSLLFAFLLLGQIGFSQNRYFTKTGTITFSAGTALEDIDAINKSVTSVFDISSGQMEFAALIKGFEFKRGLMQEHFNENYMESEKYPKATFIGNFEDVSKINLKKEGIYSTTVIGLLTIHNVKKEVVVPCSIKVKEGIISSEASFKVSLEDYKIKIPGPVKDKISPSVKVQVACIYKVL